MGGSLAGPPEAQQPLGGPLRSSADMRTAARERGVLLSELGPHRSEHVSFLVSKSPTRLERQRTVLVREFLSAETTQLR